MGQGQDLLARIHGTNTYKGLTEEAKERVDTELQEQQQAGILSLDPEVAIQQLVQGEKSAQRIAVDPQAPRQKIETPRKSSAASIRHGGAADVTMEDIGAARTSDICVRATAKRSFMPGGTTRTR
jgi:hypothetical protein